MKILKIVAAIALLIVQTAGVNAKSVSLNEAIAGGLVEVKTSSLDGINGLCMEMEITSLNKKEMEITIPSGLLLHASDTMVQDMIVAKRKTFTLASKSKKKIMLHALCVEQNNSVPKRGDIFQAGKMAAGNLLELIRYIDLKNYHSNNAAQHAVWVLTDNANIAGIFSENSVAAKDLRLFVQQLTGIPAPWYQVEYEQQPGVVFTNKPAAIHANFSYMLHQPGIITFAVYNEKGEPVQMIFENKQMPEGLHTLKLHIEARHVEPGNYYVRVYDGSKVVDEKIFKL